MPYWDFDWVCRREERAEAELVNGGGEVEAEAKVKSKWESVADEKIFKKIKKNDENKEEWRGRIMRRSKNEKKICLIIEEILLFYRICYSDEFQWVCWNENWFINPLASG